MYSTCLFCSGSLGRNESIEMFPVGRRLAFDAARGRLWVVCPRCARWNLTPLEARWEAIEDAERWYRDSRIRVSTDQIGMAKLKSGLELVRIGKPLLPEMATWRYGRVFKRRQRNAMLFTGAATVLPITYILLSLAGANSVAGISSSLLVTASWAQNIPQIFDWARRRKARVLLPLSDGRRVRISTAVAASCSIVASRSSGALSLRVMHPRDVIKGPPIRSANGGFLNGAVQKHTDITGNEARRALSQLMPAVNVDGAGEKSVLEASELVGSNDELRNALNFGVAERRMKFLKNEVTALNQLPTAFRLAMEMSLHQEDEQRAMDGELAALEDRWREAEEIAEIADAMFVGESVKNRLEALRGERPPYRDT